MRILWALVLAASAAATPAFVQQNRAYDQTGNYISTLSSSFPSANTAGNLIVVSAGWYAYTTNMAVSDTAGNTYQALSLGSGNSFGLQIFYAANVVSAPTNTVTVSFTTRTTTYPFMQILEYSGIAPTSPLDQAFSGTGASGTNVSAGSVTTTQANELIFVTCYAGVSQTAGSGFTMRVTGSADNDFGEDETVNSIGTYSGTFVGSSSTSWIAYMATFKAATAVPPFPKRPAFF